MKKLINFLRKIGLLRIAGKTYKGKNVGGDFATADMDTSWRDKADKPEANSAAQKFDNQPVSPELKSKAGPSRALLIITWILGSLLIITGLLMLLVEPVSGGIALILGLVLLNPISQVIQRRISLYRRRGIRIVIYLLLLFLLGYSLDETDSSNPGSVYNPPPIDGPPASLLHKTGIELFASGLASENIDAIVQAMDILEQAALKDSDNNAYWLDLADAIDRRLGSENVG